MSSKVFAAALVMALASLAEAQDLKSLKKMSLHATGTAGVAIEKSLDNVQNSAVLRNATIDLKEAKLRYRLPDSTQTEEISIKTQAVPWAVQKDVPYVFDVQKDHAGKVEMFNPRLELLTKWEQSKDLIAKNASYAALNSVIEEIPDKALWIPDKLRPKLEGHVVSAIVEASSDKSEQKELVDFYYLQNKSYHNNRQISFSVFEQARQTCLAACAIRLKGKTEPHGTGVLIGKNLVLTCKHNFAGELGPFNKCQALFHLTDKDKGALFELAEEYYSSNELDFSLIVLGNQVRPAEDPTFKMPDPPQLGVEPELGVNSAIYVAGYPGGRPLSVALNSQVVFPFLLQNAKMIDELAARSLLQMFPNAETFLAKRDQFTPKVKAFFSSSYQQDGIKGFFFRPQGFPAIGADPDTKHGDSGAPTYDIERNALIGLLRAGSPDDENFVEGANYENYELVIPVSQIVAELDKQKPDWKTKFSVSYYEPD